MKQTTLLALAAAASALPLNALAQQSVTLYGRLNVGVEHLRFQAVPGRAASSLSVLTSDASNWGMRGSEDLGGGSRAYFKLESGIQVDSGAASSAAQFFNRESYVGLGNTSLGSVQLGSQWGPGQAQSLRADPFMRFGPGGQPYVMQGARGYTVKYENAIQYLTPRFSGVSGRLYYAFGEGQPTGRAAAASVDYESGPIYLSGFHERSPVTAASVGLAGPTVTSKTTSVAAVYDFKALKVHGQYQTNSVARLPRVSSYLVGLSVPVSVGQFKFSYIHRDAPNADASQIGAGYWHSLSKRTMLYGHVARLTNHGTAAHRMGPALGEQAALGAAGPIAGQGARGVHVGVMHTF